MTLSEAVEAVSKLVGIFPNGSPANAKSYIGALASVLMQYPRSIAVQCVDPIQGIARETRFLPTVADVIGWCEDAVKPIREREQRLAERERAGIEMQRSRLEDLRWEAERRSRPSYDALKAKYGENWGIADPDKVTRKPKFLSVPELAAKYGVDLAEVNRVLDEAEKSRAVIERRKNYVVE